MATTEERSVGFFIGSGCSFPSGQPSVCEITYACLKGEYYLLEELDEFSMFEASLEDSHPLWGIKKQLIRSSPDRPPRDLTPWRSPAASIQALLSDLSNLDLWTEKPTYEDLAGVLNIVAGALAIGSNDPFVEAFVRITDLPSRLENLEFPHGHRYHRCTLVQKLVVVEDFIGWVIASKLRVSPTLRGYQAFEAAIRYLQDTDSVFHVVTTNYDCNLERVFRSMGIELDDGFPSETVLDDRMRKWRHGSRFRFFECERPALVKLHGSLNWFMCHNVSTPSARTLASLRHGIGPLSGSRSYISVEPSFRFTPMGSPEMLRGSLSKVLAYSYDIYSQLLMAFEQVLAQSDVLVVAGFGWNDEGVVARLLRFSKSPGKVVLIFDGSTHGPAIERSHLFDRRMLDEREGHRQIIMVRKHLSELSESECVGHLQNALKLKTR